MAARPVFPRPAALQSASAASAPAPLSPSAHTPPSEYTVLADLTMRPGAEDAAPEGPALLELDAAQPLDQTFVEDLRFPRQPPPLPSLPPTPSASPVAAPLSMPLPDSSPQVRSRRQTPAASHDSVINRPESGSLSASSPGFIPRSSSWKQLDRVKSGVHRNADIQLATRRTAPSPTPAPLSVAPTSTAASPSYTPTVSFAPTPTSSTSPLTSSGSRRVQFPAQSTTHQRDNSQGASAASPRAQNVRELYASQSPRARGFLTFTEEDAADVPRAASASDLPSLNRTPPLAFTLSETPQRSI